MGDRENHSIFFYLSKFAQYFLGAVVVLLFSWYCQVQNTKAPEFTSPTSEELKAKYEIASISPTAKGGFILDWGPYAISDGSYFKIYEVDDLGRNKGRRPLFLLGEQGRFEMGKPLAQCAVDNYAAGAPEAGCSTNFSTAFLEFDANGARFVDDSTGTIVGANKTRHFRITYVHKIAEGKYQSFNLAFCAQGAVSGCHRNQLINGVVVNESQLDTQQTGVLAQSNTIISGRTSFNAREFINARASIEYNKAEERVSVWVTMGHNTYEESSNKTRIDFLLTTKRITYYSRGQQFSDISDTSDIRLRQAAFQWTRVGLVLLGMDKETAPNNFFQHILAQEGTYLPSALPNTYAIVISPTYETNQLTRERVLYVSAVNVSDQDSRADSKFDTYRDILNDMNAADPQTNPFASRGTVVKIFGPTADNCAPAVGQPPCLHKFVLGTQMAFPSEPNVYTLNNGAIANRMHMTLLFDQQIPHVRNSVFPSSPEPSRFALYAPSHQRTSAIVVFAFQAIATFIVQNVIPMIVNAIVEQVKSSIISAILRDVPIVGDIVRAKDKFESLVNTAKSLHSDLLKAKDLLGNLGNLNPIAALPNINDISLPAMTPNVQIDFGIDVKNINVNLPKMDLNLTTWDDVSANINNSAGNFVDRFPIPEPARITTEKMNENLVEPNATIGDPPLKLNAGDLEFHCAITNLHCNREFLRNFCLQRKSWGVGNSPSFDTSKKIKGQIDAREYAFRQASVSEINASGVKWPDKYNFVKYIVSDRLDADFKKYAKQDYTGLGKEILEKYSDSNPQQVYIDLEQSLGDILCTPNPSDNDKVYTPPASFELPILVSGTVSAKDILSQPVYSYCEYNSLEDDDCVQSIANNIPDANRVDIPMGVLIAHVIEQSARSKQLTYGRILRIEKKIIKAFAKLTYYFEKNKPVSLSAYHIQTVSGNSSYRDIYYNKHAFNPPSNGPFHPSSRAIDFNITDGFYASILSSKDKKAVFCDKDHANYDKHKEVGSRINNILQTKVNGGQDQIKATVLVESPTGSFHLHVHEASDLVYNVSGKPCADFFDSANMWKFPTPPVFQPTYAFRAIEFKILGELSVKTWTGDLNASGQFDGDDYAAFWNGTVSNFEVPMALEKTDSLVLFNWGGAAHKVTGNHDLSQPEFPCETAAQVVTPNNWFFCCGGFWCAPCYNVDYRNYSCRIDQWSTNGQNGCGGNTWCEAKNNLLQYAIPTTNDLKVRVTRNRVYPTTSCAPNTTCQTTPINYPANDASYLIPTIAYEAFDANKVVHTVSILANEGTGADDNAARANYLSQFAKLPTSATNGANYYFVQRVPMPSYYKNEIETTIYFTKVTDDPATTLNEATVYNVKYVAIPDLASRELIILINEP